MKPTVLYGGTFDPVHNGHLAIARAVRDRLDTEVQLIPAADPPHKDATHADGTQRAAMLELATEGDRGLHVDRRELRRQGPSYTVETLLEVRSELGTQQPLVWLIGSDSLLQLDRWHRWRELFAHAHLLAVQRPGAHADMAALAQSAPAVHAELASRWRGPEAFADAPSGGVGVLVLDQPREESSTELRRRILRGQPWRDWVPDPVADYIVEQRLYGAT